jgi:hypothetical protein
MKEKPSTFNTTLEECLIKNFKDMSDENNNIPDYQISYGIAEQWTANWRAKYPELKAFLIPIEDLMGVLVDMGVLTENGKNQYEFNEGLKRDVRGYLGLTDNGEPHFVMVGTKKFPDARFPSGFVHRDLYNGGVDGKAGTLTGDEGFGGSGIYDFTEPCPTVCDDDSGLNGGG